MRKLVVWAVAALMTIGVIAPVANAQDGTIADIVVTFATRENPEFSILLAAVQAADPSIVEALANPDANLTVFAPTDRAFVALLNGLGLSAEQLLANRTLLNNVLRYHVVEGRISAAAAIEAQGSFVPTLLRGDDLLVSASNGVVYVDSSRVITTDVNASNGVIHVIDTVLLPDRVNAANATAANRARIAEAIAQNERGYRTIYGNLLKFAEDGQFTILLAAVQNADRGVIDALDSMSSSLTVFAPTDAAFLAAFNALGLEPAAVIADRELLTNVLLYHVLPGRVFRGDLRTGDVATLQGATVRITAGAAPRVNDARIVQTNVPSANGVIHVIDAVLLPPN
ncbi:MAG: fasciclin domain-containing protein [Anaerolineae bacterium]